ncbi:competence type IV pilus minor pilin ComGE [Streptococcus dysgalactiae subsp. equisimilis]
MEIIKKQVKAYIALESVMATGLLVAIVILVLTSLKQSQTRLTYYRSQQEKLNLALMAVQTGQASLNMNDYRLMVLRTEKTLIVRDQEGEVIRIEKKDR